MLRRSPTLRRVRPASSAGSPPPADGAGPEPAGPAEAAAAAAGLGGGGPRACACAAGGARGEGPAGAAAGGPCGAWCGWPGQPGGEWGGWERLAAVGGGWVVAVAPQRGTDIALPGGPWGGRAGAPLPEPSPPGGAAMNTQPSRASACARGTGRSCTRRRSCMRHEAQGNSCPSTNRQPLTANSQPTGEASRCSSPSSVTLQLLCALLEAGGCSAWGHGQPGYTKRGSAATGHSPRLEQPAPALVSQDLAGQPRSTPTRLLRQTCTAYG